MGEHSSGGDKFLYFLAGAGIGAVLALLFAPKSGKETRELIARTASDGRDFLTNKVTEGKQFVGDTSRKVTDASFPPTNIPPPLPPARLAISTSPS